MPVPPARKMESGQEQTLSRLVSARQTIGTMCSGDSVGCMHQLFGAVETVTAAVPTNSTATNRRSHSTRLRESCNAQRRTSRCNMKTNVIALTTDLVYVRALLGGLPLLREALRILAIGRCGARLCAVVSRKNATDSPKNRPVTSAVRGTARRSLEI